MLYLSLYFKTHRQYYYELLNEVRLSGNWEAWLDFFAEAVIITANQAVDTTRQLTDLSSGDRDKISGLGRAADSTFAGSPGTAGATHCHGRLASKKTTISPATVNKCLNHLESLGIVWGIDWTETKPSLQLCQVHRNHELWDGVA